MGTPPLLPAQTPAPNGRGGRGGGARALLGKTEARAAAQPEQQWLMLAPFWADERPTKARQGGSPTSTSTASLEYSSPEQASVSSRHAQDYYSTSTPTPFGPDSPPWSVSLGYPA